MNSRLFLSLLAAIALLTAAASRVWFLPGENPYPDSIEAGYAAMTRWIAAHPDPFGWNPLQYEGLPTHRLYLPGLHYLAAAVSWVAHIEPVWAYRLVTAVFLCLTPLTSGFLAWYFTRSKPWTLAVAIAVALLSPAYKVSKVIGSDRGRVQLPWRLHTHVKYGEGPHNAGLALLPLAIVAVHRAASKRTARAVAIAAAGLAVIPLTNLVAALALAYACFVLLAAGAGRKGFTLWPPLAAAALAYAMACWWLTPQFITSISGSWAQDALGFKLTGQQFAWLALLAGALILLRFVFRGDGRMYLCFLTMALAGYATVALVRYATGRDVIPESHRYALEMEIFLILWVFESARLLIASHALRMRIAGSVLAGVFVLWCLPDAWRFLVAPAWRWQPVSRESMNTWRVAKQIASMNPAGRVFATGVLRFRWNSWFDIPQATGNFETALINRVPVGYQYQIVSGVASKPGEDGTDAVNQLVALGVEYVALHRRESEEFYKDFRNPDKFKGLLEPVWSNAGDVIYRVPFRSLAHVMRLEEMPVGQTKQFLPPFVRALADNERPLLSTRWEGPSRLVIEGDIPEDHLLIPLVSYDAGWHAVQNGQELWIENSWAGYLRVHALPGSNQKIVLEYTGEPGQKVYAGISVMAWLAGLVMFAPPGFRRVSRSRVSARRQPASLPEG